MTPEFDIASLQEFYTSGGSPETVVREVYRRIAAHDQPQAWISLVPESDAVQRAKALPRGPLYGVPFAVKDNIDAAGLPTTCACPAFGAIAESSAFAVERLQEAGAIVIGKTNLDQFATGLVGTRSPYGIPTSVFDPRYVSGGSSSGSAVAVAAGLVSFALGTDTAGSGRIPAGFNNIVGLKPTKGLISTRGLVPACRSLDVISVFALTVHDADLAAGVARGFDGEDAFSRSMPVCESSQGVEGLRVGVPSDGLQFFGDSEYERLYREAVARAEALGTKIVEIDFSAFREAAALLYDGPWVAERLAAIEAFAAGAADEMHDVVRGIILSARGKTAVEAFKGQYRLAELIRRAEREWQKMDVLLLPTAGTTYTIADVLAEPVQLNSNLGYYTNFVNLMDLSALAVPAGFRADGIPFGVTLIGPAFHDALLAQFGDRMHRLIDDREMGCTGRLLSDAPPVATRVPTPGLVRVAVVGAHLSGQPLNRQLTERGARLVRTARTAAGYSLHVLSGTTPLKPGLVFDGRGAGGIEVEIWEIGEAGFGSFVALIPAPLGIGTIALEDGSSVQGFLCEAHAVAGGEDITHFGGWRAWLAGRSGAAMPAANL